MFFTPKVLLQATFLVLLIVNDCRGQNQRPADPPIPVERFKLLSFQPPAPDILAALKIPILDGEKYGLADATGKILLEPQFDDIDWTTWDMPVFLAQKNGNWAFYDFNGRIALPLSSSNKWELAILHERKGFRFDERGNHIELVIPKIKDPRPARFTEPSGETKSAPRYYFLKPDTRPPFRAWFLPDYSFFIQQTRDRWMPGIFTSGYQYENLKIMDEKGRFGLLDRDGNMIQTPVRNCATIGSPEKILILDEHDHIALRDAQRGWQTDFLFNNIETTPQRNLFLGEFYEQGQPLRLYSIDSSGRVVPIEGMTKMQWLEQIPKPAPKNRSYQIVLDTSGAVLKNLRTGTVIFSLPHGEIGEAGMGYFELKKDKKRGWIDSTGHILLPAEFDKIIGIWQDRRLIGIKNGLAGLFDLETGEELLPVAFPYLSRYGITYGRGVGIQIRSGQDQVFATKDLEVTGQKGPNAPVKRNQFKLPENVPAAVRSDFEKAVLPETFTSIFPIIGPGYVHFFQSDGAYLRSMETGPNATTTPVFCSRNAYYLDEGNSFYTGFARIQPAWPARPYYVRMHDGKVFKK